MFKKQNAKILTAPTLASRKKKFTNRTCLSALIFAGTALPAYGGSVSGPGASADVSAGDNIEEWDVSSGAELRVNNGAETLNITVDNARLLVDGATLMQSPTSSTSGVLQVRDSQAILNNMKIAGNGQAIVGLNITPAPRGNSESSSSVTVTNSQIDVTGRGANMLAGSQLTLNNTIIRGRDDGMTAYVLNGGVGLSMFGGSVTADNSTLHGDKSALVILAERDAAVDWKSQVVLNNSTLISENGSAIVVDSLSPLFPKATADILISGNSSIRAGNGTLMEVNKGASASLTVDGSQLQGDIRADTASTATLAMRNGALLEGNMLNLKSVAMDNASLVGNITNSELVSLKNGSLFSGKLVDVDKFSLNDSTWRLIENSTTSSLEMSNGHVDFNSPVGSFRTLTVENLSGTGTFYFGTDVARQQGDFLDVTGQAEGSYVLNVANTGAEAEKTDDALRLVRTAAGNAQFTLKNGAVDIGAWQYTLKKNGNQWELVQSGTDPETPYPLPKPEPGTDPETPYPLPHPIRSTSASTDAVLNMASATKYMFYGELKSLRNRVQQTGQNGSGVWGTFLHNRDDIEGSWESAYSLRQNGMLLGADHVSETSAGSLTSGVFLSQSSGKVRHARGGTSDIDAWGGGFYASLLSQTGWYAGAIAKINRFDSDMSAVMTDGGGISGSWETWGWGMSLEGGRQFSLTENVTLTPYVALSGYQNQDKKISLSNSMAASLGNDRSLRAEAGTRLSAVVPAGSMALTPYLDVSVSRELVDSDSVRINDRWDFDNDRKATFGRVAAGMSLSVTSTTSIWADVAYGKGDYTESPATGNVGVSIRF